MICSYLTNSVAFVLGHRMNFKFIYFPLDLRRVFLTFIQITRICCVIKIETEREEGR